MAIIIIIIIISSSSSSSSSMTSVGRHWQALAVIGPQQARVQRQAGSGSMRDITGHTAAISSSITVTVSLGPLWNKLISPEGFS